MELKKCIVLDLDNTLWGGVVGEDGSEGIQLSLHAPGNSFLAFQQALLDHYDRGVLLAINSRNNPEDALAVIREHPNMVLKEKHFAASRINWADKSENLKELAKELNIGLDSMVFLDDDPTNRAQVRALVPEVEVPELPKDPREYVRFLNSLPYFPGEAVTDEDSLRGNLYVTERLRQKEEERFTTKEEFLGSLGLRLEVFQDDVSAVSRLSQMTGKTNQFNIDKKPYTEDEMCAFIDHSSFTVFHGKLSDRFGDYGVITLAVVKKEGTTWHLDSLLMSCRVFGRGVEDAFLSVIADVAQQEGAERLTLTLKETEKNTPAREFAAKRFPDGALSLQAEYPSPEWITL